MSFNKSKVAIAASASHVLGLRLITLRGLAFSPAKQGNRALHAANMAKILL